MSETTAPLDVEAQVLARATSVAGIDEVGRGALAGPVMVGVTLVTALTPPPRGCIDSKKLTATRRKSLVPEIHQWAHAYGVGAASAEEIDQWGLRICLALAAERAIDACGQQPEVVLIDGPLNLLRPALDVTLGSPPLPEFRFRDLDVIPVVGGDAASATIAAASILAKVARDELMSEVAAEFPEYEWDGNKGYGSARHLDAIAKHGPTPLHRRSWNLPGAS